MAKAKKVLKYKVKIFAHPTIIEVEVPAKNKESKAKAVEDAMFQFNGGEWDDVYKVTAK